MLRPRAAAKPPALEAPLIVELFEDTYRRAGMLSPEQLRDRIAELEGRDLDPAERKELARLVGRRQRSEATKRRSDEARKRWAAMTPAEQREWGAKVLAQGSTLSGEDYHWLHVTARLDELERRNAKQLERLDAEWATDEADYEAALAERAKSRHEPDEGAAAAKVAGYPSEPEVAEATPAPRRRRRVGIVAQYDAFGRRLS